MPSTQRPLISLMRKYGYRSAKDGICAGLVCMMVFADLCNEETKFEERIQFITDLEEGRYSYQTYNTIEDILPLVRKKVTNHQKLNSFEKKVIELDAFFACIEIAHNTDDYKSLIDGFIAKADIERLADLIGPQKIQAMGGIKKVFSVPVIGNSKQLSHYLHDLSETLGRYEQEAQQAPDSEVAISLYSTLHRIRIKYIPEEGNWMLTDPNNLPSRKIAPKHIASAIMKAFYDTDATTFQIELFASKNNPLLERLEKQLNEFKQSHPINKKNAGADTGKNKLRSGKTTLAHVAAMHGDLDSLKKIAAINANYLTKQESDGYTPLMYAAQYGHSEVVTYLASFHPAALKEKIVMGISPLRVAIMNNHVQVIKALAAYKELFRDFANNEEPLIILAARNLKIDIFYALADIDRELLKFKNRFGETAVQTLLRAGADTNTIMRLAEYDINFLERANNNIAPIDIAINSKQWDMVMAMLLLTPKRFDGKERVNLGALQHALNAFLENQTLEKREDIIYAIAARENALGKLIYSMLKRNSNAEATLFKKSQVSFDEFLTDLKSRFLLSQTNDELPNLSTPSIK